MRNVVFYSLSFLIRTRQYPSRRLNLVKYFAFQNLSYSSLILGRGYQFLTVISFSCLQLTQRQSLLFFLRTNRIGYPAGNNKGRIYSLSIFFSTYFLKASSSCLTNEQIGLNAGYVSKIRGISWSYSQCFSSTFFFLF